MTWSALFHRFAWASAFSNPASPCSVRSCAKSRTPGSRFRRLASLVEDQQIRLGGVHEGLGEAAEEEPRHPLARVRRDQRDLRLALHEVGGEQPRRRRQRQLALGKNGGADLLARAQLADGLLDQRLRILGEAQLQGDVEGGPERDLIG